MTQAEPLVVVWRVTGACNLSCRFCAYARDLVRSRDSAQKDEVLRVAGLLAEYGAATGRTVLVSWLGGEPFLWPPLEAVSRRLAGLGLRLGATTNGVPLLAPAPRELAAELFDELTFSVDGLPTWHDQVRARPGLFLRLRQAVMGVREAAARRGRQPLLKVNTILMRQSVADFEALCAELLAWGVTEVTFNQLGGNDRPEFYPEHRLQQEQVERFVTELPAVRERLAQRGLLVHGGPRYLARLRATASGSRLPVEDCGPGRRFLFVDERGRVSPCSFTSTEYGVPLAELCSADDVAGLPARLSGLRSARRAAPCDDCHSTQVCDKFADPAALWR